MKLLVGFVAGAVAAGVGCAGYFVYVFKDSFR